MKKIIQFFCIAFISLQSLAALPKSLHIATEATYPPFEFIDSRGKMQGFDIDIMNALCKEIKITCIFSNQPWDSLIPGLKLGKFDVLIGGMNITEERKQQVDFTDPYYKNTYSFVGLTNKGLEISVAGLKGKTIGVQGGTTAQYFLQDEYPDVKIKTYAGQQDAFLDLISDRLDFVFADSPVAQSWLKDNHNHRYAVMGKLINNTKYFDAGYGIALRKGNAELLAAFNKALAKIKSSGEYQKIVQKYFGSMSF